MHTPFGGPIEAAHHVGLVLIRWPCSFSQLIHLIAVPHVDLGDLNADLAG